MWVDTIHALANKCLDQSNKLERLISNLLTVSKVNAGKIVFDKTEFGFKDLLKECIENFRKNVTSHTILLEKSDDVLFNGDKTRLEQVINNLISNAIKYSPQGIEIIVKSEVTENSLVLSVQDFGIIIEPENLSMLFERYYRVDHVSRHYQGLGLGLYIAAEILRNHNGNFWVQSVLGEGSAFSIQLPLIDNLITDVATDNATFYHTNKLKIDFHPDKQYLEANWNGFQNMDTVLSGGLKMINFVGKIKCTKVLNDNTHVLGNWGEASEGGANHFFPLMQNAGCRFFAWIYSPSIFAQLAAQKSAEVVVSNDITTRFFNNSEEAVGWLEMQ